MRKVIIWIGGLALLLSLLEHNRLLEEVEFWKTANPTIIIHDPFVTIPPVEDRGSWRLQAPNTRT